MDWSQEETLQFLELFQIEQIIWDPRHKLHKNNQKVNDAWKRISEEMGRPLEELKGKKNSLMATFRQHLRRKKQSMKSGASADDIHKPIWIYYDVMEAFLAPVYLCDKTLNTEERPIKSQMTEDKLCEEQNNEQLNKENIVSEPNKHTSEKKKVKPHNISKPEKRSRENIEIDIQNDIKETVSNINNLITNKKKNDECDMYAQILATRLREYSIRERRQIMHGIDGYLLANPPLRHLEACSRSAVSPAPSFSSSSNSFNYNITPFFNTQNRPSSRTTYVQSPERSPVQISIPDRPASHDSTYAYVIDSSPSAAIPAHSASVLTPQNRVTILSQEIIQPSQSIIDRAYTTALDDDGNYE